MVVYHVTDRESAARILNEGLVPMLGRNSAAAGEKKKRVYLCPGKSIPYWALTLGKRTVLKVTLPDDMVSRVKNRVRNAEYTTSAPVPAAYITLLPNDIRIPDTVNETMCLAYLHTISRMCVRVANLLGSDEAPETMADQEGETLAADIRVLLDILNRLDYTKLEEKNIKAALIQASLYSYSLASTYKKSGIPLWKMLPLYKGAAQKEREELCNWIKANLAEKIAIDTGEWGV